MENVMTFLADNYIWFFVAAGILCFALIGFVIESRKKQKNEFKGESIEESNNVTQTEVASPVQEVQTEIPVQPVVNQPQVEQMETPITPISTTPVMESVSTPEVSEPVSLEDTMEINDIPMSVESLDVPKATSNEFYNGPVEMPSNNEVVSEVSVEPVQDLTSTVNETSTEVNDTYVQPTNEPIVTPTVSDTISYEQTPITPINETVSDLGVNNNFSSLSDTEVIEEKKEEQPTNIFDNMN